ncbi:hypothetical protein HY404_00950 [Candidatus Microgenomates bacterium]|nr:hypothetical protein [Candidatus Microgenomates bacterium]
MKKYKLVKLEQYFFKKIITNRHQVIGFVFLLGLFYLLPTLPYFNLYIKKELILFMIMASFMIIFKLSIKIILLAIFLLLFISLLLIFLGEYESAELLGNYVYGFLVVGLIIYFLKK